MYLFDLALGGGPIRGFGRSAFGEDVTREGVVEALEARLGFLSPVRQAAFETRLEE